MRCEPPKKIRQVIQANNIKGIANGYMTLTAKGPAYTAWDKNGKVVCSFLLRYGSKQWEVI